MGYYHSCQRDSKGTPDLGGLQDPFRHRSLKCLVTRKLWTGQGTNNVWPVKRAEFGNHSVEQRLDKRGSCQCGAITGKFEGNSYSLFIGCSAIRHLDSGAIQSTEIASHPAHNSLCCLFFLFPHPDPTISPSF